MSVREYIGARYVPLFADPIDWDSTKTYEPLTIVYNQGNSYTSRQYVPAGIDISNDTYWARTGNYNAQIEQYRSEVATFDGRITTNETNITDLQNDITDLQNATVGTEKLDDNAVTTAKIKNANVTTDKLADNAVTTAKILDANVTTAKILDANVTTDKLADNAVTTDKLADNSVTTAKILDANVTTDKLADNAVTTAKILDANVTTDKLADNAVTTDKLADNSVTTAKILDANVTTDKLADSAVTTAKIKNASITNSKIAKGTLLIFSDSWGDFESGFENWATNIAAFLNCEYKNYSIGGGGFINHYNGKNFFDMYNKAVTEVPSNEANYVIIIGGTNDVNNGNTIDSTTKQAIAFCNNVTTAWPNAKVYAMVGQPIAPYDLGISSTAKYMNNKHLTLDFLQSIVWKDGKVVPITGQYSMGGTHLPAELLRTDGYHLNANGRKAMESLLRNCICGNSFNQFVNEYRVFHFENDSVMIHMYLTVVNGMLTTGGNSTLNYIKFKNNATSANFTLKISDYPVLGTMLAMPQQVSFKDNDANRSEIFGLCFAADGHVGWYNFDFYEHVQTNSCHITVFAEAANGIPYYIQPFSYPVI